MSDLNQLQRTSITGRKDEGQHMIETRCAQRQRIRGVVAHPLILDNDSSVESARHKAAWRLKDLV